MSISFAGLGIVSLQNPFTELASLVVGKGDIRSMLCLLVFCIVSLVLAYLTNPSENSFRAYLTEQSFRQHLSRLDDTCEDGTNKLRDRPSRSTPVNSSTVTNGHVLPFDGSSPFHFANRASVSLRTPKHVFHSFGIFTVAAMIPLPKSSMRDNRDGVMISDSWYIGAFGKWWRGGVLETWYQDVISRSKDEESWSSGILSMKSLDMLQDFTAPVAKAFVNGSPPKLRNRERTSYKSVVTAPRSITPPPLPKSASLPLHATRILPTASERPLVLGSHPPPAQPLQSSESNVVGVSLPSRSPSTLFDQSPRIAHVLEQISASKTSLVDLRVQLHDCQTSASQTHALLQEEVNSFRERKRIEDTSKLETKSRTKTLEDSKRSAEALKREADKKLKTAQSAREHATQRIESLDEEMAELQECTRADEETLRHSADEVPVAEQELIEELGRKKQEIKETEDIVASLNQRARELEDQLNEEREKLRSKKTAIENRKAKRLQTAIQDSSWTTVAPNSFTESTGGSLGDQPSLDSAPSFSPYRPHLTLGTLSAFNSIPSSAEDSVQPAYDAFSTSHQTSYSLSGFADEVSRTLGLPVSSPTSQSLIPSGLITSLDSADTVSTSRTLQSDTGSYVEKEWRDMGQTYPMQSSEEYDMPRSYDPFSAQPVVLTDASFPPRRSSLDGYPVLHENARVPQLTEAPSDFTSGQWPVSMQTDDDMLHFGAEPTTSVSKTSMRRWFPTLPKDKSKKGLNPDAKEFSLSKAPAVPTHHSLPSFDNLNPTGLGSSIIPSSTSTSESLFLRAFAPSPAEREALQRALGGANTSFERLPSLSNVGSIPSSPSHIHALPIAPSSHANKLLPSWLPGFPRSRKTQFSPWGDEELPKDTSRTSAELVGNSKS